MVQVASRHHYKKKSTSETQKTVNRIAGECFLLSEISAHGAELVAISHFMYTLICRKSVKLQMHAVTRNDRAEERQ